MRGHTLPTRAERRIRNDHTEAAAREFHHRILDDGVRDDILEDSQLADIETAIVDLERVRDQRRNTLSTDGDPSANLAFAIGDLQEHARARIMEVCALRAKTVLNDGGEWVAEGWEDADDVAAAQREAAAWLRGHRDVPQRVFDEESIAATEDA